jgi:hypothetical protein
MQQALVEALRFDIEEGNFSDTLLEKIGCVDIKMMTPFITLLLPRASQTMI